MSDPVARLNAALEGRFAIEREPGEGGWRDAGPVHRRHTSRRLQYGNKPTEPNSFW